MTDVPPAEIFRRLRPIPANAGVPVTSPHDILGVSPQGAPLRIPVLGSADPVLLLFLKADCLGCHDLWSGLDELRARWPEPGALAVVTRDPGGGASGAAGEDAAAIAELGRSRSGVPLVMSSAAFSDYRVGGPPFYVVVDGERVRTEGVAWGLDETLRAALVSRDG